MGNCGPSIGVYFLYLFMHIYHPQATYPSSKKGATSILSASLKTSNEPVETKSIFITSPGAQARCLQQKLASGRGITILRKVNNEHSNTKFKNLTTPDRAVTTSGKPSPPQRVSDHNSFCRGVGAASRSEFVPVDATGNQAPIKTEGQRSLVKPKPVALKVTPSGIITPANTQLLKLATNYRIPQQKLKLQLPEKPQRQSQDLYLDKRTEQPREQKHKKEDANEQQVILPKNTKDIIPVSLDRFRNVNLNQVVLTQKNRCIVSTTTCEEKVVHPNHNLMNSSLSRPNNCSTSNTVKIVSAECQPMVKTVIAQSFGVPSKPQLTENTIMTPWPPKKTVKFPMSSLFSLNLGNTGSLLGDKLKPQPISPKVASEMQQTEVKPYSKLQRKISPHCSTMKKDVNGTYPSSDSDFSFGLNAISVQHGLQRALSLTPFSAFLDDDAQSTVDTKAKGEKPVLRNEKTNFVRSQQIINEQLARISQNIDKAKDILSNTKKDDAGEKKSDILNKIPAETHTITQQNTEKNANHSSQEGKVKMKYHFTATAMDDEDLKDALAPSAEESSKYPRVHKNADETEGDNSDKPDDADSFQMKVFAKVMRSILPTEAVSPGDSLQKYGITECCKTPTSKKKKDIYKKKTPTGDDKTSEVRRLDK